MHVHHQQIQEHYGGPLHFQIASLKTENAFLRFHLRFLFSKAPVFKLATSLSNINSPSTRQHNSKICTRSLFLQYIMCVILTPYIHNTAIANINPAKKCNTKVSVSRMVIYIYKYVYCMYKLII